MELQNYKVNKKSLFALAFVFLFVILAVNSFFVFFAEDAFEQKAVQNERDASLDAKLRLERRMINELANLRIQKQTFFAASENKTERMYETLKTKIDQGLEPAAAIKQLSRVSDFNYYYYFFNGVLTFYEGTKETKYLLAKEDALLLLYQDSIVRFLDISDEEFAAVFVPNEHMNYEQGRENFTTEDGRKVFLYAVGEGDFRIEMLRDRLSCRKWEDLSGGIEVALKTLPPERTIIYETNPTEVKPAYAMYLYYSEEYNSILAVYGETSYMTANYGYMDVLHADMFNRQWIALITCAALSIGVMLYIIQHVDKNFLTNTFRSAKRLEEAKDNIKSEYRNLFNEVNHDVLTGAFNRGFTDVYLADLFHNRGEFFSCIMSDIDDFKKINDTYGHEAGDMVLKEIAVIVFKNLRNKDVFARWGGEEFLIIIKFLNIDEVYRIADRIRDDIEKKLFVYGDLTIRLTMSFGIACLRDADEDYTDIIARADKALYRSKASGKNMVTPDA